MAEKTEIWISKGYEFFSLFGEKGLIIEQLAKKKLEKVNHPSITTLLI